jgi:hypothetical protein
MLTPVRTKPSGVIAGESRHQRVSEKANSPTCAMLAEAGIADYSLKTGGACQHQDTAKCYH